jgi:hypothetical protein
LHDVFIVTVVTRIQPFSTQNWGLHLSKALRFHS